jgi:hypothetical protein
MAASAGVAVAGVKERAIFERSALKKREENFKL